MNLRVNHRQMTWTISMGFTVLMLLLANAENTPAQWNTSGGGDAYNTNSSGKVGIGTQSPNTLLELNAATPILTFNASTINSLVGLKWNGTGYGTTTLASSIFNGNSGEFRHEAGYSGYGGFHSFFTNGSERLRINSSGNVGIGTTSPSYPLEVTGASLRVRMYPTTGTQDVKLHMSNTAGDFFVGIDSSTAGFFGNGNYAPSLYSNINAPMNFYTNNAFRMTIGSTGNVGIGTTDPTTPLSNSFSNTGLTIGNGSATPGIVLYGSGSSTLSALRFTDGASSQYDQGFVYYNHSVDRMGFGTSRNTQMVIDATGNVGIGTTSPTSKLTIAADGNYEIEGSGVSGLDITTQASTGGYVALSSRRGTGIVINTGNNVGIGTETPAYKLDVNGDTNVKGNLNITANGAGTGNIVAAGTINAKYQDVAEWVPSSEQLAAGTVVVLDSTKSNQVISSSQSYDTRVAGVISAQPGIALGEKSDNKVLVATTGRVKVKVDASKGPIHIGDLLVTSDVPGMAMKSEPIMIGGRQIHGPGTLIGKALEPLEKGKGEILVLLSLQ